MDVEHYIEKTGSIYGNLFTQYSNAQFQDSVELFFIRHRKWGIDLDWFKDKKCLDAGCGGGRFMVALSWLGAHEVRGIDISKDAIAAANERFKHYSCAQADAQAGRCSGAKGWRHCPRFLHGTRNGNVDGPGEGGGHRR